MAATLSVSVFQKEVASGSTRPTYLFSGQDDYLIDSCVRQLIDTLLSPEERSLSLSQFYGKETEGLREELDSPALFGGHRVVLVRQSDKLKPNQLKDLSEYLKQPAADICLILTSGPADKKKAFFKNFPRLTTQVLCKTPQGNELAKWAAGYLSRQDKALEKEGMDRLMAINWPTLGELAGELDKLALMADESRTISMQVIEESGGVSFAFERWNLSDAVGGGDIAGATIAVENLMQWGLKPPQIVGDLFRLFWTLWVIKGYTKQKKKHEARKLIYLPQVVYERYSKYAASASIESVEDGIIRLEEAELNIKRGLRSPDLEVSLLVTDLSRMLKSR